MTTGTEQQQMPRRRARWLCLAALALSALFPVSIALAVLADRLALSVVGMLVVMGGGRLIARAGGYQPASSWESSDVGALADPHLRRLMAWAGWPVQPIIVTRWILGAAAFAVLFALSW